MKHPDLSDHLAKLALGDVAQTRVNDVDDLKARTRWESRRGEGKRKWDVHDYNV